MTSSTRTAIVATRIHVAEAGQVTRPASTSKKIVNGSLPSFGFTPSIFDPAVTATHTLARAATAKPRATIMAMVDPSMRFWLRRFVALTLHRPALSRLR